MRRRSPALRHRPLPVWSGDRQETTTQYRHEPGTCEGDPAFSCAGGGLTWRLDEEAPIMRNPLQSDAWQRCFIALAPDDASRDALMSSAVSVPANARRVPPAQLHLTVAFIGALAIADGDALATRLAERRLPLTPAPVTQIECWPGRTRPRLMVAVLAMTDEFVALDWHVRSSMIDTGLPVDARAFRPHITLARFARDASAVTLACDVAALPPMRFTSLVLYSSTRAVQGARYQALASVPLARA
jgi:2'-5' RNA ligase